MTPAAQLLHDLRAHGITLETHGDRLRFKPAGKVDNDLRAVLAAHKADLMELLAVPVPSVDLPSRDDGYKESTPSPSGGSIIEQHAPTPRAHSRRLAGNGFPPFPHGPMDSRIVADPVVMCPTCSAARVLPELRTMTGGRCWECHQREQQATRPQRAARAKRQSRRTTPRTMTIEQRPDGWWIANCEPYTVDGETFDAMGPYTAKAEADDDLRGLLRTMQSS